MIDGPEKDESSKVRKVNGTNQTKMERKHRCSKI